MQYIFNLSKHILDSFFTMPSHDQYQTFIHITLVETDMNIYEGTHLSLYQTKLSPTGETPLSFCPVWSLANTQL